MLRFLFFYTTSLSFSFIKSSAFTIIVIFSFNNNTRNINKNFKNLNKFENKILNNKLIKMFASVNNLSESDNNNLTKYTTRKH